MIETERLILRRWRNEDREPFARINADPQVVEHLPAPLGREESDALIDRIEAFFEEHGFGRFAVEEKATGELAGMVGLNIPAYALPFSPCVEIGWRLAPPFWGRGYASEAARSALQFGFKTAGLPEIVAFTVPANVRSQRVMQRIGMTRDQACDFDHPSLPEGHPLRRHVLYRCKATY